MLTDIVLPIMPSRPLPLFIDQYERTARHFSGSADFRLEPRVASLGSV